MTIDDVKDAIAEITKHADDDPTPHKLEDKLYREVLEAIRDESLDEWAASLAAEALMTQDLDITRWYE